MSKKLLKTIGGALLLASVGCTRGLDATGNILHSHTVTATVTIASDVDLTDEVDLEDYALATVFVPSTFDGTQFKLWCSDSSAGTFLEVKASDDTACTVTTAASQAAPLVPSGDCAIAAAGCRYAKIETVTDQSTTDTVFQIALKR